MSIATDVQVQHLLERVKKLETETLWLRAEIDRLKLPGVARETKERATLKLNGTR